MKICINYVNKPGINETLFEVVERKGLGHPDTIADTLAEIISAKYSNYTLNKYGHILRHMVDKLTLLGGKSKVSFGHGKMLKPIRILLNGRFTSSFCGEIIDYMSIAESAIKEHFLQIFPTMDLDEWVKIIDNTHSSQGPGVVYDSNGHTRNERYDFFTVKEKKNAKYHNNSNRTNDTSTTVSYAPLSKLEQIVILIENILNSCEFKKNHIYIGNDIKVMAVRNGNKIEITTCIPFIAEHTPNQDFYTEKLGYLNTLLVDILQKEFIDYSFIININTRDSLKNNDAYLTVTGSALESGDEGSVGRGNRSRGTIPFSRNSSLEAPCGKNPVYHTGKLFTVIGNIISDRIFSELGLENTIFMTSQMGGDIKHPWSVGIEICGADLPDNEINEKIKKIVKCELNNHTNTTLRIIRREIRICE